VFVVALVAVLAGLAPAEASANDLFVGLGVGLPELLHAEVGYGLTPRLTIEAQGGAVVFNWMVGASVTGRWFGSVEGGRLPRHHMIGRLGARLNPTLWPLQLEGDGAEVIGAMAEASLGYGFRADSGLLLQVLGGGLLYEDNGVAGGVNVIATIGWALDLDGL